MYQRFFIGHGADQSGREIDTSTVETLQQLLLRLGQYLSFADPSCQSFVTPGYQFQH